MSYSSRATVSHLSPVAFALLQRLNAAFGMNGVKLTPEEIPVAQALNKDGFATLHVVSGPYGSTTAFKTDRGVSAFRPTVREVLERYLPSALEKIVVGAEHLDDPVDVDLENGQKYVYESQHCWPATHARMPIDRSCCEWNHALIVNDDGTYRLGQTT